MALEKRGEVSISLPIERGQFERLLQENYGDTLSPSFDRVKMPTGGGRAFSVPGIEEEETHSALDGVVLAHHKARAYWPGEFTGGSPPACSSLDGRDGYGEPGGRCLECPNNQWGSDERGRRGKACKEMHRVYVLQTGEMLPLLLTLPPTSLQAFIDYANRLLRKGIGVREMMTRFSLTQDKNEDGITYSKVLLTGLGRLSQEQVASIRQLGNLLAPYLGLVPVEAGDYLSENDATVEEEPSESGLPLPTIEELSPRLKAPATFEVLPKQPQEMSHEELEKEVFGEATPEELPF